MSLTYAERRLIDGGFQAGLHVGFSLCRDVIREARQHYALFRKRFGYATRDADMLTPPTAQAKLNKSERWALGLMLTPSDGTPETVTEVARIRRAFTLCPNASDGCRAACLSTSGHGAYSTTQQARHVRTAYLLAHPYEAGVLIGAEVARALRKHAERGVTLRLNVTSDIRWEYVAPIALTILMEHGVVVYDYTAWAPDRREPMPGYHLTYSAKETSHTPDDYLANVLRSGHNVAMPFHVRKGEPLPSHYMLDGQPFVVIDGDLSDDRTLDPVGVIVGLRAKGTKGKADSSGFIRTVPQYVLAA